MTHHKKTWPDYFQLLKDGKKKFDVRLADFEVNEGDTIIFEEWDPKQNAYTGRKLIMKITFIIKTKELPYWSDEDVNKHGHVVMQVEQDVKKAYKVEVVVATMIRSPLGEILFVKSPKFDDLWVLPGGHVEVGEKILNAAVRETYEETNLTTNAIKLISTHELISSPYFKRDSHMIALNCLLDAVETNVKLNDELTEYKWIDPKKALKENVAEIYKEMLEEYIKSFL
jgi:nucleoside triphosphatase